MNWLFNLFGHDKRMAQYKAQLAEIRCRRDRLAKAAALHIDVINNYGLEAHAKLLDVDSIIADDKQITVINYLDI